MFFPRNKKKNKRKIYKTEGEEIDCDYDHTLYCDYDHTL